MLHRREFFGLLAGAPAAALIAAPVLNKPAPLPEPVPAVEVNWSELQHGVEEMVGDIAAEAARMVRRKLALYRGVALSSVVTSELEMDPDLERRGYRHFASAQSIACIYDMLGVAGRWRCFIEVPTQALADAVIVHSPFYYSGIRRRDRRVVFRTMPLAIPGMGVFQAIGLSEGVAVRATLSYDPTRLLHRLTLDTVFGPGDGNQTPDIHPQFSLAHNQSVVDRSSDIVDAVHKAIRNGSMLMP